MFHRDGSRPAVEREGFLAVDAPLRLGDGQLEVVSAGSGGDCVDLDTRVGVVSPSVRSRSASIGGCRKLLRQVIKADGVAEVGPVKTSDLNRLQAMAEIKNGLQTIDKKILGNRYVIRIGLPLIGWRKISSKKLAVDGCVLNRNGYLG